MKIQKPSVPNNQTKTSRVKTARFAFISIQKKEFVHTLFIEIIKGDYAHESV